MSDELDLEECKELFDVRLYESNDFYPMKMAGIKLITEVERLRECLMHETTDLRTALVDRLKEENSKLRGEVKTLEYHLKAADTRTEFWLEDGHRIE